MAYRPPDYESQQREANDAARRVEAEMKCERDYAERRLVEAEERKAQCERDYAERRLVEAEERKAQLRDKCKGLQGQVDNLEEVLQAEIVKRQRLQKALEASPVEGTRLQYEVQTITASRDDFQTHSENLAEEKKKLEDSLRSTKGELAASRRKVEEHEVIISNQHAKLKEKTKDLHSETSAQKIAENTVAILGAQCRNQGAELGRLKTQVVQLKDRSSELERNLSAETEAKETLQKDFDLLSEAKTKAEKEIEKRTHIVKYLKEEAKTKDEEYRELESKYTVLENGRENAQPEKLVDAKREVQALKDKGRHRREVMQQVVKLLQTQVAAVRSDLDQERSRQSELKDSVEQLLTRSFIVRFLKTELVSRAAELQKYRDELRTTTAERDRLRNTIAMKQYMDQQFHRLQEQMTRNLVQIVTKVIAGVHEVSAGVSELNKEVQQLQDQTSSTSVQQTLTGPAPISKNLTEDGTRPQEMLCMSQPQTGVPNALVKYQPGGAEGASVQCSSPGSAMDFWQRRDRHARTTGQTSRAPLLQESVDPSLLQQALTLQKLMPYISDLADKGSYIAGYLDMQKQWDSWASSHPELGGRLQKLLSTWLEGEDSETPHTWGFFISLVQKKGIDQHQLARKICSNLNTSAPNSYS